MHKKKIEHLVCGLVILLIFVVVFLVMRSKKDVQLPTPGASEGEIWQEDSKTMDQLHLDAIPPTPPPSFLPQSESADDSHQTVQGVVLDLYDQRPVDGNVGVRVELSDGSVVNVDTETSGFGAPVVRGEADTVSAGDRVEIYGETVSSPPFGDMPRVINIFGDGLYLKKISE